MKRFDHIHQRAINFAKTQIKLHYHNINTYNYEEVLLLQVKC
jgi:hypothetical protein